MSLISDHKERTAPLTGQELAIIEDEDGLRGIRTDLLRGLLNLGSPGPIGGTTPDAGTFNTVNLKAASSGSTLGPERVTNGTFDGNADGWTLGQNWAYGTNNVVLTLDAATEGTLSQTISGIESGKTYQVSWSQTHSVANNGRITAKLGETGATALTLGKTTATPLKVLITAAAGGDISLSFTVSQASGGTGSITLDDISIKEVTPIPAVGSEFNAEGNVTSEKRIARVNNFAQGIRALEFNIADATANTAIGFESLKFCINGWSNNGIGLRALWNNTSGTSNSAFGQSSLSSCVTGSSNTGVGNTSGVNLTTGSNCSFVGSSSGLSNAAAQYDYATAIGAGSRVSSSNTVVLGRTTDNTVIGATGDDGSGAKLQVTGSIKSTTTVKSGSYAVAGLPSAATAGAGARAFVTDANATTFLSVVAGGGSNKVPVVSDGTNWLIG